MNHKILFAAMITALAALVLSAVEGCSPAPTPTQLAVPSRTQTIVTATVTIVPPTATRVLPTSTRVSATSTPTLTPTSTPRPSNEPPPISITLTLAPEPNLMTATFTARGNRTQIELNIGPSVSNIAPMAVIRERLCDQPGILRYSLANFVNGKSTTILDVPFAVLLSGALNLDVKKSGQPGDASLACVVLPEVWFIKLDQGSQPGTVVVFEQVGGIEMDAFIKPGPPGVAQPALVREGTCKDLGAIRYTLNSIVDGTSKTWFGTRWSDFRRERGALNVHKSVQELDVSVACGVLIPPE